MGIIKTIKDIIGFSDFDYSLTGIVHMFIMFIDAIVVLATVYASTETFKDYATYIRLPAVGLAVAFRYVYLASILFF